MNPRVVVVGDVLIDELVDETGSRSFPGGSALNVAVGLAILGTPTTLVGMVGDDADGEMIRSYLAEWGVEAVLTLGPDGTGRALSDRRGGEPTYRFNQASKDRSIVFDESVREAFSSASIVAISGFPFDDAEQVELLTETLKQSGAAVAIDPNPRSGLMRDRESFRANLEKVASSALLLKLGEEDAMLLYEMSLSSTISRLRLRLGSDILATEGKGGASVYSATFSIHRPIAQVPSAIVDTMGAGDATFAVVLHALAARSTLSPKGWYRVLDEAMLVAARTIRHPGALLRHE
ncbi:MAG: PfkB family carbohydrate kinase [Pseudolysinimonas sp.]